MANWSAVAARRSSIGANAVSGSTPCVAERAEVVDERRRSRSRAARRRTRRRRGTACASTVIGAKARRCGRTSRRGRSRCSSRSNADGCTAASPIGSAPSPCDAGRRRRTRRRPRASACPAWRTTGATSSRTPSSAALTPSAVISATPVRSRRIDVAPRSSSSTARPGPAAASTSWRTSHPPRREPRTTAAGSGASSAVYSGSMMMPSYVVERSRSSAASGSDFSALATAASQSSRVADALMSPGYDSGGGGFGERGHRREAPVGRHWRRRCGVAPVPVRSWRRSIHTVGRPAALAGSWSWYSDWATCSSSSLLTPIGRWRRAGRRSSPGSGLYEPTSSAVITRSNSTPSRRALAANDAAIDVGEDDQAEPLVQPGERVGRVRERRPVAAPTRRTPPARRR